MKQRGQGVVHVKNLFAKYLTILKAPQKSVLKVFVDAVEMVLHRSVPIERCSYSVHARTVTVTVPGMFKTEILLKKKEILGVMTQVLGPQNTPKDIV